MFHKYDVLAEWSHAACETFFSKLNILALLGVKKILLYNPIRTFYMELFEGKRLGHQTSYNSRVIAEVEPHSCEKKVYKSSIMLGI